MTPLPYVATHIIYTQFVGLLCTNGMSRITAIIVIPSNIRKIIAATILIPSAFVATTGSIFPFGFGGKTERFAGYMVQLADKFLTVVPTNALL